MSLKLHPDCKDRLKQELAEHLKCVDVKNKCFLDRASTAGFMLASNVLPKHGPITESLEAFIGEWPLYDFLYGYLSKELHEEQAYDPSVPVSALTEIEKYSEVGVTADKLVELFDTLPWHYTFSLKLPSFLASILADDVNSYQLSDTLRLVRPDEEFIRKHPLRSGIEGRDKWLSGNSLLSMYSAEEWDHGAVYLQITTDGFVGKYIVTETNEHALSLLKAFLGLSIALRLTKVEHSSHPASPKERFYVHRYNDGEFCIDDTQEVSEEVSRTIGDLVFHDLDGELINEQEQKVWMGLCLSRLRKVFSIARQSDRIVRAGQWFFDSYTGRNELLSFLQAMVALEILLGDKATSDVIGLNELLRNRCAYLIGKDYTQREEILLDFKEIYEIRSKIVHRGKRKLKVRESVLFDKLRWLCRRVIQEEVDLLNESA